MNILSKYKKQCITIGVVLAGALLAVYLKAMLFAGLWHGDAFLYRQDDGSFKGSDIYAEYSLTIKPSDYGTDIDFSVNDKKKKYQIKYKDIETNAEVEIVEDGKTIFKGETFGSVDGWMLLDDDFKSPDGIVVHVGNHVPTEDELFPGYTQLYNWAVLDRVDMRGNPAMLFLILIFAAILFLDIKFPNLFWILEHGLEVDGGEPSDWYLFGQKVGRIVMPIGILVCVVLTFTIH